MDSSFHSPVCRFCTIMPYFNYQIFFPHDFNYLYLLFLVYALMPFNFSTSSQLHLISFPSIALMLMSLFPNVPVSLHPFSLCVTCHLSLHSPQPNISIMDMSDHVSVFLCPSPFCSSSVFRL